MSTQDLTSQSEGNQAQNDQPLTLTPKAIEMVRTAIKEEGLSPEHGLRIAVRGGGCSGLEYALDFTEGARMGDTVLEFDGLQVFVDMASLTYLKGTTIDYVAGLNGTGFKFLNPNAKRTCGCGSSFGG